MTIELVIFDLGGTIVDFGCRAPVEALCGALATFGVEATEAEIRAPMGLGKRDHIRQLLAEPRLGGAWRSAQGSEPNERAVDAVHDVYVPLQVEAATEFAVLVPGFVDGMRAIAERGARLAVTTGYPRAVADSVLARIRDTFVPAVSVCTDEVAAGRPAPDMLQKVLAELGIEDPGRAVAVGDTVPDVLAARRAGTRSVAVLASSSAVGLDYPTYRALGDADRLARLHAAAGIVEPSGPDLVLTDLGSLPGAIERW